jgi:CRISPR-associated protein (TIGR02710 family)
MRALWDRFDHEGALAVAQRDKGLETRFSVALKNRIRARKLLTGADAWSSRDVGGTDLVVDLVENGEGCARRGRYDDAFGRLYRATELLAQVRLRREHQVSTSAVELAKVPEASRVWLEKKQSGERKIIQISMFESYRLLDEWGDSLGAYFTATRTTLERIIQNRNNSLFAHGLTAVSKDMWEKDGVAWRNWLTAALAVVTGPGAG